LQQLLAELQVEIGHEALMEEILTCASRVPGIRPGLLGDIKTAFARLYDPLMVAQIYAERFKPRRLIDVLRDMCRAISQPSAVHDLLCSLECRVYVTTNYDNLLERALSNSGVRAVPVFREEDLAYWTSSDVHVIKMHGSLADVFDPESVVITRSDYEAYSLKHPNLDLLIQFIMSTGTLLLLGYSLRDPEFLAIHDRVRYHLKSHKRLVYLIAFDLPEVLQDYWAGYGVYPLNLDGKDKEAAIMSWLTELKARIAR
jgi:hypothetical protein